MNSRNKTISKYLEAKQNRRTKARYQQKRLRMGLAPAVPLKPVSLDPEAKDAIASTEVIGTAKQKRFFVTRHFGWPVSLGIHLLAGFLLTVYAVTEYIPEEPSVSLDFMEPVRKQRRIGVRKIKTVKPADSVRVRTIARPKSAPTAVEIPTEQERFHTPTDTLLDAGAAPSSGVSLPQGFGNIGVQQQRAKIPTEMPGVKIERDTQIAPEDRKIDDIGGEDLGGRDIQPEVQIQVDQEPRVLRKTKPDYPAAAKRAGREGSVTLEFTVGVDERAADITVIKEEPKGFGFGEAAIESVKLWHFNPAKKDGQDVPMRVKITIRFTLDED